MHKPGFITLRMKGTCPYTCPGGHPDNNLSRLSPPIMNFSEVIYNLIKAFGDKIRKLHFHNRFESLQAHPQCRANDSAFTKWRITHSGPSEFFNKTFCYFKSSAIFRNVLSHQNKILMFLHALV